MAFQLETLSGWGNHPREPCLVAVAEKTSQLPQLVTDASVRDQIARGLGRAYGDSALNRSGGVIVQTRLNRFRAFNEQTGELECEAGVSLAEIIECLLPQGWFPPVTPGTRFVTVGGAIAADVHGKNHHAVGSLGNFVQWLDLLLASGEMLRCSPSEHAPLFWATVGGMGLTGIIVRACIKLARVPSAYCRVQYRRCRDLDQTLELLESTNSQYAYSVAWIDCLARGPRLGRSVLMLANNAAVDELPDRQRAAPLRLPARRVRSVPCQLPGSVLNRVSVSLFNELYYRSHGDCERLVDFDSFFYPLDSLLHWNRIYGRRGFAQYQALLPPKTSRRGMAELLGEIGEAGLGSFLAVLKSSGQATPGVLSYLYPGHTLALDLPNVGERLVKLCARLDQILLRHGGRLYLAKDSMTDRESFAAMYPRLGEFQQLKNQIDPSRRFVSSQARRLGIVEAS
jgi:decaprenylphospho-beta-D-ribofuranose 2-oxidase